MDTLSYKEIGVSLRNAREAAKYDVRQIAQQLHIRAKYLTALEEGELDVMPGKVYARGYIRQYAQFLGLDADAVSDAFDRVGNGGGKVKYFVPEPTSRHYQPGILIVAIALAAMAVVYTYWYGTHKEVLVPSDIVAPVPERLLSPVVTDDEIEGTDAASPSDVLEQHDAFVGPSPVAPDAQPVEESTVEATPEPAAAPAPKTTAPAAKSIPAAAEGELPWKQE